MTSKNSALVLGATGGIGGEVARQLLAAGWDVRALKRGGQPATEQRDGITWIRGDAMNREEVVAAAAGCSVIVHAVNPPGYRRWAELVLPMLDNTIAAATAHGATIVLPGTVYNYGPNAFPVLREDSPQQPETRKGAIRVELEERLRSATTRGCRVIIVRAGDFFGPKLGNSWFSQGLIKPKQAVTAVNLPAADERVPRLRVFPAPDPLRDRHHREVESAAVRHDAVPRLLLVPGLVSHGMTTGTPPADGERCDGTDRSPVPVHRRI